MNLKERKPRSLGEEKDKENKMLVIMVDTEN